MKPAARRSYIGLQTGCLRHVEKQVCCRSGGRPLEHIGRVGRASPGFTLVEVMVASVLILILLGSLFSVISYTYYAGASTESLNTAKNIADYCLEYLRARNITTGGGPSDSQLGSNPTFYDPVTATTSRIPGLVDLSGRPLAINIHPMYPDGTVEQQGGTGYTATFSTLQGYVSLRDVNALSADPWETNAKILPTSPPSETPKSYFDMITDDPYVIRFGTVDAAASPAAIHMFSSSTGYVPYIWSARSTDLHFAPDPATGIAQTACDAYAGYRILTRMTAHSNDATYKHVQYYDVQITVYWMVAGKERSYATRTTIATY